MNFAKKYIALILLGIIVCMIVLYASYVAVDYLLSELSDLLCSSMHYEIALEGADDFCCAFYRDGTYRINYHSGRYSFDYYVEDEPTTIFPSIKEYSASDEKKNNLYIQSKEGYVMLERGNKATFYLYEGVALPDVVLADERVSVIRIKSKREVPFRKVFTTFFRQV